MLAERQWTAGDGLALVADDWPAAAGSARLPVLCLHGLTRNARDFDTLGPRLAGLGRRVLAPDMRGRGRSAWGPSPAAYHPLTYAADVAALTDQTGIGRALFVGTSMGGLIMMELARLRPELIAGAIVNDVGPEIAPEGVARILSYAGKSTDTPDWEAAEAYVRERHAAIHPDHGADDWRSMTRRLFREGADGRPALDYDPAIGPALLEAAPMFDPWGAWRALAVGRATLLLRGALSDLLSADIAARMIAAAPDARLVEVPRVGHAPTLDEPEAVAAIAAFMKIAP